MSNLPAVSRIHPQSAIDRGPKKPGKIVTFFAMCLFMMLFVAVAFMDLKDMIFGKNEAS